MISRLAGERSNHHGSPERRTPQLILAGIGAVAATKEKSEGILDELVKKGELTVEQGKVLNEELKHNIKDAIRENVTLHVVTPEQTFRGSPSSFLR